LAVTLRRCDVLPIRTQDQELTRFSRDVIHEFQTLEPGGAPGPPGPPGAPGAPGIPGTTPVGAPWTTALDLDLLTAPAQAFNVDGAHLFLGYTWTRANSAGGGTIATDGTTGLAVTPTMNTDFNGAIKTLPFLTLPLPQAIANVDAISELRLWAWISAYNGAANFDVADLMLETNATANANSVSYHASRGIVVGGAGIACHMNILGSNPGFSTSLMAIGAANDVCVVHVPSVAHHDVQLLHGSYAAGWPAASALTPVQGYRGVAGNVNYRNLRADLFGLTLGAHRATSGTALVVKFGRVRVDYR